MRFVIFSAGWNCEKYVAKSMRSVQEQAYTDYVHVVVDDASTDGTYDEILKHRTGRTVVYRSGNNRKWLPNAVEYLPFNIRSEEDVIVVLDLDDWLIGTDMLGTVAEAYKRGCWVTYGQCSCPRGSKKKKIRPAGANPEILEERDFRNSAWVFNHLQTFKAFLWNNIDKKDFLGPSGEYIPCSYDRVLMLPILEMTPSDRIHFLNRVVYFYNQENPLCNFRTNKDKQRFYKEWLKGRPRYEVLKR